MKLPTLLATLATTLLGAAAAALAADPQPLPWQREMPLREAAKSVVLESTLNATNPLPDSGGGGGGGGGAAMTINNLKMRTTLWGPPRPDHHQPEQEQRLGPPAQPPFLAFPTLQEITDGRLVAGQQGLRREGAPIVSAPRLRLPAQGRRVLRPLRQPVEYPMPCMKPVGQIIMGMDPLAGAAAPEVTQKLRQRRREVAGDQGRRQGEPAIRPRDDE